MSIMFDVPGRISGKGRPRFVRATGIAFTPQKTRNMEAVVRSLAQDAMEGRAPFTGPVELDIAIRIVPPKSWSRKKREAAEYVIARPDLDNCVKLIGDALNGIAWLDDSQIARLGVVRLYTQEGPERATIRICEIGRTEAAHESGAV